MKNGIYFKLAFDGIRKNRKLFLPYIGAGAGMVMMSYIIFFLTENERILSLKGGEAIHNTLGFGCSVMAIFSCIFLFYTNSFLIRSRKKEYGLYGVLGMGKRQLVAVCFFENLLVTVFSLFFGLVFGIAFSKFAELGLVNIASGQADFSFSLEPSAILKTAVTFTAIFMLVFLNSARQMRFSDTVALLKGESTGEKPPKGNVFLGTIGFLMLCWAYYIAVTIENPVSAMVWFFAAVVAVIIATYLLMISGSVALCRALKKNRKYYYKKNHFVALSSMAYRMKRNGAGLASICVLSTMVLVTVATTASMFFGAEDSLRVNYPRQINVSCNAESEIEKADESFEILKKGIAEETEKQGSAILNTREMRYLYAVGCITDSTAYCDRNSEVFFPNLNCLREFIIVTEDYYNGITEESIDVSDGTCAIRTIECDYKQSEISFDGGPVFTVSDSLRINRKFFSERMTSSGCIVVVVKNLDDFAECMSAQRENALFSYCQRYGFDTDLSSNAQIDLEKRLEEYVADSNRNYPYTGVISRAQNEGDFYGTFGGLFYLGILLSIVFALAAVLIIYYKQISEGYEDSGRFEIMAKVGMTDKEIKSSINSQLLTVFFVPLLLSGLHLAFSLPMIKKILELFGLTNTEQFLLTAGLFFAVFALFYVVVYKLTARAYYGIVSRAKERTGV